MDKYPSAQIIVLNWNGLAFLDTCLSALSALDYPAYEILLADNDSTDGSVDFVRRSFPHIKIMQNGQNLGYAAGNNRALRDLHSDYAVLVNPDIVVPPDWLSELILPMEADSSTGIGGCKLHYPDGQMIQHAGGSITHPRAVPVHHGMLEQDTGQYETMREVDYVTGAAIAIKRPAVERIGLLDEGFFMYFEEADWCARARTAGYRVLYIPQATAVHDESAIAVKGSFSYLQRFHTGRWRYLLKHFDPAEILAETITAEEQWLLKLKSNECQALKRAYRTIHTRLDEILTARQAAGGIGIGADHQAQIEESLIRLRKLAISQVVNEDRANQLVNKAEVQEISFRSQIPVIGALIAQLRSIWASIAAREQAKTFAVQQNEFNHSLVKEVADIESRIQSLELDLLKHDVKQVDIKQHQSEVRAELTHAYELLKSIKARLEHLENTTRDR